MKKNGQDKAAQAVKKFREACNSLAGQINVKLFEDYCQWWWVGDEIGGVCCFGDSDFLRPEEMVLILEEDVTYEQYEEWQCANLENDSYINLQSWLNGCRHNMLENGQSEENKEPGRE